MNRPLSASPILPIAPVGPNGIPMSHELRAWLNDSIVRFNQELVRQLNKDLTDLHTVTNTMVQGTGDTLVAGTSLQVDHAIHAVSGTDAVSTIVAPDSFSGPVMLLPLDAFTLATGGNVAAAATAVPGEALVIVFDLRTELWYPVVGGAGAVGPVGPVGPVGSIGPTGPAGPVNMRWEPCPLVGAMDGVNRTYSKTVVFAVDPTSGVPEAMIRWRYQPLWYVSSDPLTGQWTLVGQDVVVGEAPQDGDDLAIPFCVVV